MAKGSSERKQEIMCEKTICPLLHDPGSYNPDTLDLAKDLEARDYWYKCFLGLVNKFAKQAIASQQNDPTAVKRAEDFQRDYINRLNMLQETSGSEDDMTIRRMLELNDLLLKYYGFFDPWSDQKVQENKASIERFSSRLEKLDALDNREKWVELVKGLLAGNMFDWGAQAVAEILQSDKSFGLDDALKQIQQRPWLVDQLDDWLERLKGPPHKCAVIFVDNSGIDIILGVLPFARELLMRQTKVLLCANTGPSLNDVTSKELEQILDRCCDKCYILQRARINNQLLVYATGQSTPCLDLRKLSPELCLAMKTNETDLIVIEGMGRALHTNLYAKFCCETFKLAVVKNKWLAAHLGGEIFSGPPHKCAVIFVDNSGIDIILGVLPFARELLMRQTKVLLCANTGPSLNDVTSKELEQILDRCCDKCYILQRARINNQLLVYATGQSTPCLDLRKLSPELCLAMKTNETDLIVIEGMGRALHTNLYAKFCCETFKLAVVKNKWLAAHLGGEIFSVICKYEGV